MNMLITAIRRAFWLALIGTAVGAVWKWQQDRNAPTTPPGPPEWPPIATPGGVTGAQPKSAGATSTTITTPEPAEVPDTDDATPESDSTAETATSGDSSSGDSASSTSIVNALIDAPEARSGEDSGAWVAPNEDGSCPDSHPIKANDNSGIYHVPGGSFYSRTKAERCYTTAEAAAADGYRPAKS